MGIAEELDQLAQLHAAGALTDAEWTAAKARLLDGTATASGAPGPGPMSGAGSRRRGSRRWWWVAAGVVAVVGAVVVAVVVGRGDDRSSAAPATTVTVPVMSAVTTAGPVPAPTAAATSSTAVFATSAVCADVDQAFAGSVFGPLRDVSNQGFLGFIDAVVKQPAALDKLQQSVLDLQTDLHVQQTKAVPAAVQAALGDLDAAYARTDAAVLARDSQGFAQAMRSAVYALRQLTSVCTGA